MAENLTLRTAAEVKAEMARQDVKQRVVAGWLGISQTQVSARLRGRIAFNTDELGLIAQHLDVPVTQFFPRVAAERVA